METIIMISAVGSLIVTAGAVGGLVFKVIRPALRLSARVTKLEALSRKDYENMQKAAQFDRAACGALIALLKHSAEGNNTGAMKAALRDLEEFLIGNIGDL